jgi:hypothetical protein
MLVSRVEEGTIVFRKKSFLGDADLDLVDGA